MAGASYNNVTFDCAGYDANGNRGRGYLKATGKLSAVLLSATVLSSPLKATGYLSAKAIPGLVHTPSTDLFAVGMLSADIVVQPPCKSWVWTSHISYLDFTEDESGEVTKRPMPWSGYVYAVRKLGKSVISYGSTGITEMNPQGVNWGVRTIHPKGLKGKNTVVVLGPPDEPTAHCLIDSSNMLCVVTEKGIEAHDYSNWFASMSTKTTMHYDLRDELVYISDATQGFVFNPKDGLGKGLVAISGVGYNGASRLAVSPGTITYPAFDITTDTLDFESRKEKTITGIDLGLNASNDAYAMIYYRWNKSRAFFSTPLVKADAEGKVHVTASGVEFKIRVCLLTYENIQLDYVNVRVLEEEE